MKTKDLHKFKAIVDIYDFGRMKYTVVYIPKKIERDLLLSKNPRLRIQGTIHHEPFSGACQPTGASWYLLLSKRFLKEARLKIGDLVDVRISVADQDAVEVPEDLQFELNQNDRVREKWNTLSPGKKRSLAYRVASAKRAETREQRILEVIDLVVDSR